MSQDPRTIIVGLSGPSSSGKTTLARLLREIFNTGDQQQHNISIKSFILHEDDFYKSDTEIPFRTISSPDHGVRSLQDWDCVESLDLPLLEKTLQHVSRHGRLPPDMISKEDQNSVGDSQIRKDEAKRCRDVFESWVSGLKVPSTNDRAEIRICFLDGFLLYPPPPAHPSLGSEALRSTTSPAQLLRLRSILQPLLSLRLFLPSTRNQTIDRRAARTGYVTMEGFWTDPPGYVEDVVWENYRRDYEWMFEGVRDCDDGVVDVDVVKGEEIVVGPGPRGEKGNMGEVLGWGVDVVMGSIEENLKI